MGLILRNGVYYYEWSVSGKRRSVTLHKYFGLPGPVKSRKLAERLFARLIEEEAYRTLGKKEDVAGLKDLFFAWLKAGEKQNRPRTSQTNYQRIQTVLKFCQANQLECVSDYTKQIHRLFLSSLKGKPATANRYTATVRAAFNWAVKEELISVNPISGFKLFPEDKGRIKRVFTAEELQKLFDSPRPFSDLIKVTYYCLLRQSEVCFLDWDDIDFDRKLLYVRAKEGFKPKSGQDRVVPLSNHVTQILLDLPKKDKRVFPNWQPIAVSHKFRDLRERLGIAGRFHDLRHTGATYLMQTGASPKDVQTLLGHLTPDLAMKVYIHSIESGLREAVNRL